MSVKRKRVWNVRDFAAHLGISTKAARTLLKRLNDELDGGLLMTTGGKKPEYTFFPARLARDKPEIFEWFESLESRVDELEEGLGDVKAAQRRIVAQVGQNTRDVAKIRSRGRAA